MKEWVNKSTHRRKKIKREKQLIRAWCQYTVSERERGSVMCSCPVIKTDICPLSFRLWPLIITCSLCPLPPPPPSLPLLPTRGGGGGGGGGKRSLKTTKTRTISRVSFFFFLFFFFKFAFLTLPCHLSACRPPRWPSG